MEGIGIQGNGISEVRVLACATGLMAGRLQILCLDVCVKGHPLDHAYFIVYHYTLWSYY
jgi:hypothetical protein